MITLEELKERFPWSNVPPYGDCVVINADDYDPEWESDLKLRNVKPISTTFKGSPVYLLPLKGISRDSSRVSPSPHVSDSTVAAPSSEPSPTLELGQDWQPSEDELLIKLWNRKVSSPKMVEHFPNRSLGAIRNRLTRLIRQGKIETRWHHKKKREKAEEKKEKVPGSELVKPKPSQEEPETVTVKSPMVLEGPLYSFMYCCRDCGMVAHVTRAHKVWTYCPYCGRSLIIWDVEPCPKT
jgi:rubrerythrin